MRMSEMDIDSKIDIYVLRKWTQFQSIVADIQVCIMDMTTQIDYVGYLQYIIQSLIDIFRYLFFHSITSYSIYSKGN